MNRLFAKIFSKCLSKLETTLSQEPELI